MNEYIERVREGTILEIPYGNGRWEVTAVEQCALLDENKYTARALGGHARDQVWMEPDLEKVFDVGAKIVEEV